MRTYLRVCAAVCGLIGLGFLLPAVAGQPPSPEPKVVVKAPARPQLTVKVFKLERADPGAVTQALNDLLDSQDTVIAPMPTGGPAPAAAPLGALGFGGGIPGQTTVPAWRATTDERIRAVIVRGSDRHLKIASDLVAVLDRRENAPLPPLQVIKAFALKHAESEELANVIQELEFDDLRLSSPGPKLLVALGPDEATRSIGELVKELDVPDKPDGDPKKEPEAKKEP